MTSFAALFSGCHCDARPFRVLSPGRTFPCRLSQADLRNIIFAANVSVKGLVLVSNGGCWRPCKIVMKCPKISREGFAWHISLPFSFIFYFL